MADSSSTATTTTTTTTTVSLKLLVNKTTNKVMFAEANKDFVDFLFHILSLPIGTIIRLLTTKCMIGSLGNLYESLQNLNRQYIEPSFNKEYLLKPTSSSPTCLSAPLLLSNIEPHGNIEKEERKLYRCAGSSSYCNPYVSKDPNVQCPECRCYRMSTELKYVASASNKGSDEKEAKKMSESSDCMEEGYVKGVVSYMVMDDLAVQPMSTISSITLFSKFSIKDVSALEEKLVSFGFDQALSLMKASLQSDTVLTDVFLGKSAKD